MRVKNIFALMGIILSLSLLAPHALQAQDGGEYSDEEIIDRIFSIVELEDSYTSYEGFRLEMETNETTITVGEIEQIFSDTASYSINGYVLQDEEDKDRYYDVSLTYFESRNGETLEYVMDGEIIVVEQIAYANMTYSEATENALPLEEGWLIVETVEDIPEAYEGLSIDQIFDDDLGSLFENKELMVEYATSASYQQKIVDTDDGDIVVDEFTVTVDGENFGPYFRALYAADDPETNPLTEALINEGITGEITLRIEFTEDGNIRVLQGFIEFSNEGVDGYAVAPEQLPEGTLIDWYGSSDVFQFFTNINGEFEPITPPVAVSE